MEQEGGGGRRRGRGPVGQHSGKSKQSLKMLRIVGIGIGLTILTLFCERKHFSKNPCKIKKMLSGFL
jgi:hypothetical protein